MKRQRMIRLFLNFHLWKNSHRKPVNSLRVVLPSSLPAIRVSQPSSRKAQSKINPLVQNTLSILSVEDLEYTLTLFIPLDVGSGILTMHFMESPDTASAPGAAIYQGSTRFANTDGIIMVDEVFQNTITGSVFFTAVDDDGNEIAVTGFFNKLPLPTR